MLQVFVTVLTFLVLDAIWLGVIAKQLYLNAFSGILRVSQGNIQPLWPAALVVYFALILGLLVFVVPKAQGSVLSALLWGGVFGFVTYAIYDFTNLAVLSQWSLKVSIIDTLWGVVLCGVTSAVAVLVAR